MVAGLPTHIRDPSTAEPVGLFAAATGPSIAAKLKAKFGSKSSASSSRTSSISSSDSAASTDKEALLSVSEKRDSLNTRPAYERSVTFGLLALGFRLDH